ncbi:MAG: hypothetical protein K2K90_13365 [Lachnospiraceae bacterium]|nr:hypothetical protein [Lachnospiraceae bacterium]
MKIEVRGLDRKENWRYGEFNGYAVYDGKYVPSVYVPGKTVYVIPDENTICLYSGKSDKNGKKIYAGDILENRNGTRFEVRYGIFTMYCPIDDCMMENVGFYVVAEGYFEDMPLGPTHEYAEIIGDIFKNPELIISKADKKEERYGKPDGTTGRRCREKGKGCSENNSKDSKNDGENGKGHEKRNRAYSEQHSTVGKSCYACTGQETGENR